MITMTNQEYQLVITGASAIGAELASRAIVVNTLSQKKSALVQLYNSELKTQQQELELLQSIDLLNPDFLITWAKECLVQYEQENQFVPLAQYSYVFFTNKLASWLESEKTKLPNNLEQEELDR